MTRWATGAEQITAMLAAGELEQVAPSPQNAARLLAEADRHLRSAALLAADDPAGAYDMVYAAARKAMAAALATQGLRATSKGGHVAVQEAVTGQLGTRGEVVRPFGRLRRTRNDADYPRLDSPELTADDVHEDLPKARQIVAAMAALLPYLAPWRRALSPAALHTATCTIRRIMEVEGGRWPDSIADVVRFDGWIRLRSA